MSKLYSRIRRDFCCNQNQEFFPPGSVLDTVSSHGGCIRIQLVCEKGPKVDAKVEYDCFKEGFESIGEIKDYMEMMFDTIQSNTCSLNNTTPEPEIETYQSLGFKL